MVLVSLPFKWQKGIALSNKTTIIIKTKYRIVVKQSARAPTASSGH